MDLGQLVIDMEKNEIGFLPFHTTHKNQFLVEKRLKYQKHNYRPLEYRVRF